MPPKEVSQHSLILRAYADTDGMRWIAAVRVDDGGTTVAERLCLGSDAVHQAVSAWLIELLGIEGAGDGVQPPGEKKAWLEL